MDGGFLGGAGLYRSPATDRVYLLQNGFVVGEVPRELEKSLAKEQIQGVLHVEAELDYIRRKLGNLNRYACDLDHLDAFHLAASVLRTAADFRLSELAHLDFRRLPAPLLPRLVQLGNTGHFAYAHGGWRHILRPAPNELELLRRVPSPQLISDEAIPTFAERERRDVDEERATVEVLKETLRHHPDARDVDRSYG